MCRGGRVDPTPGPAAPAWRRSPGPERAPAHSIRPHVRGPARPRPRPAPTAGRPRRHSRSRGFHRPTVTFRRSISRESSWPCGPCLPQATCTSPAAGELGHASKLKAADAPAGGCGDDLLLGNHGDDTANGDAGDDTLGGEDRADELFGHASNDNVQGGRGDATNEGGSGNGTARRQANDDLVANDTGWRAMRLPHAEPRRRERHAARRRWRRRAKRRR